MQIFGIFYVLVACQEVKEISCGEGTKLVENECIPIEVDTGNTEDIDSPPIEETGDSDTEDTGEDTTIEEVPYKSPKRGLAYNLVQVRRFFSHFFGSKLVV